MIGSLGAPELAVIFLVALILFGASKIPAPGESLGNAARGFKKALNDPEKIAVDHVATPSTHVLASSLKID